MKTNTGNDTESPLSPQTLAFFGEITASVTHELSNVLGTVDQVVGLIEDLALTREAVESGLAERMNSVVERVAVQSGRGTALIRRLNSFAHLNDSFMADCDLGPLLGNIVTLSERFARLRKVEVNATGFDRELTLRSSPILLAHTVYAAFRRTLHLADRAAPLEIELAPAENGARVTLSCRRSEETGPGEPTHDLPALIEQLGGHMQESEKEGRYRLDLTIVSRPPRAN
jgi:C4-dicarboxylate-specific signal transduction histidine kinase